MTCPQHTSQSVAEAAGPRVWPHLSGSNPQPRLGPWAGHLLCGLGHMARRHAQDTRKWALCHPLPWFSAFHAVIQKYYSNLILKCVWKIMYRTRGKIYLQATREAWDPVIKGSGSRPGLHSVLNKDETHVENGNESPWEMSRFSGKEPRSNSLTPHTRVYLSSQLRAEVGNIWVGKTTPKS